MKSKILIISILLLLSTASFAQRVDRRQKVQRNRIHEGRNEGEVTNGEAVILNREQRSIRRNERRANADGKVTPREKMRLERKQNRASRHIHRAKNNGVENK